MTGDFADFLVSAKGQGGPHERKAMNYNHLVYFQKLAKYENYRIASEELHITQPSLSNAIHHLEADLGVALFEKSGRGVRLTGQGQRFLKYVNNALRELRNGEDRLHYEQVEGDSILRLGIVMSAAYDPFSDWIRDFQKKTERKVFYACTNDTSDGLCDELCAGNLDLIICTSVANPKITFTPLYERGLVLLTPHCHRFSSRESVSIEELNGEAFIAHSRKTALHDILADIYREHHIRVRIISEADEDRAILGMVRAGLGCAITTPSSEIYGTDFCTVPITGTGFRGEISVGRRVNEPLSEIAEDFYTYLLSGACSG